MRLVHSSDQRGKGTRTCEYPWKKIVKSGAKWVNRREMATIVDAHARRCSVCRENNSFQSGRLVSIARSILMPAPEQLSLPFSPPSQGGRVAGRNEWEAADNFVAYLHETLSCVTAEKLALFQQSKKLYKVWFNLAAELATGLELNCSVLHSSFWGWPRCKGTRRVQSLDARIQLSFDAKKRYYLKRNLGLSLAPERFRIARSPFAYQVDCAGAFSDLSRLRGRLHFHAD